MSKTNLSPSMQRVLRSLYAGLPANSHCRKQADHGGLCGTLSALRKRGLITRDIRLTDAGRAAASKLPGNQ